MWPPPPPTPEPLLIPAVFVDPVVLQWAAGLMLLQISTPGYSRDGAMVQYTYNLSRRNFGYFFCAIFFQGVRGQIPTIPKGDNWQHV